MLSLKGRLFRTALNQSEGRLSLAERRMARRVAKDEDMMEILAIVNDANIPDFPDTSPDGAMAALGDGVMLERIQEFFKWFVENLPAILDQIKTIIEIFDAFT